MRPCCVTRSAWAPTAPTSTESTSKGSSHEHQISYCLVGWPRRRRRCPGQGQCLRLRAGMGRTGNGDWRRAGQRDRRHHRPPGRAPDPGATVADRGGAQGADSSSVPAPSWRPAGCRSSFGRPATMPFSRASLGNLMAAIQVTAAGNPGSARPLAGRHPRRRQSTHRDRPAQRAGRGARAGRSPQDARSRPMPPFYETQFAAFDQKLAARIEAWQKQAARLRGMPDRDPPQRLGLPRQLAGPRSRRGPGAQAGRAADHQSPGGHSGSSCGTTPAKAIVDRRLRGSRRRRSGWPKERGCRW